MTGPHLIGTVTVILSFLAGMAFGGLLYFRHRRTGMVGLAATCAGMALIVVVTETAGGSTIGHALKMAAFFGLFSPMLGAVLACIIIVIVRFLCRITRRALEAVRTFIANVLTDVCRIVTRRGPRTLSNASIRTLAFLVFTVLIYVYVNISAIWDFAERVLPRISVITNVLDLLSLLLATPKLYTMETRKNVRGLSIITLRLFTFKFVIPHSALAYVFGGAIIISLPLLLLLALSISQSYGSAQFIMLFKEVDTIFPNPVFEYIIRHLIDNQNIYDTKIWQFLKPFAIVDFCLLASIVICSTFAKDSPEAQERLKDKLLYVALVLFAYSRALSMTG